MIHSILCGILIAFFAWLLLHALMYSKSGEGRIIEGLEPSPPPTATPTPTPTATATATPTTAAVVSDSTSMQVQMDENTAQLAILKNQIASLIATSVQLNETMLQNEDGIKNNTALIQKVVQSQNDTNSKLASMKRAQ
jgi:hypothetical protein